MTQCILSRYQQIQRTDLLLALVNYPGSRSSQTPIITHYCYCTRFYCLDGSKLRWLVDDLNSNDAGLQEADSDEKQDMFVES